MPTDHRTALAQIRAFPQLITYLRDEMGWPIKQDSFDEDDDIFYEYTPEELGIDVQNAAKIQEIKRLRPLSTHQPWGVFFVKFEPKRLPVVALRRILSRVALKKRASANSAERAAWSTDDLLFISNYGEGESRQICFAHFSQNAEKEDLPVLKVLGWDNLDSALHLDHVAELLTNQLSWPDDEENESGWRMQWHSAFTLVHREVINTSKELSVELAGLARNIRNSINTVLSIENENGPVSKLMAAFQEALVHDLDEDGFADMYAQTIAYGLLSARITNPSGDTSDELSTAMPVTNPFLKELMATFLEVGGRKAKSGTGPGIDFDELGVSDVIALLDAANMEAVLRDFGDRNPQEDPVIHFFEGFLQEYDKKIRKNRGVFYTPRPVVSFIVRSVDELLRTEFGLEDGLADTTTWGEMAGRIDGLEIPNGATATQGFVQILDPATGTGTFLVEVIDLIYKTMTAKWQAEGHGKKKIERLWNDYVPNHLLPRLHGYELMMAPYAIAHMKIGLKLYETGYRFESDERARVYLTNALEPAQEFSGTLAFAIPALAHEAEAVNAIKRDRRFTVVIGNPPYSVSSTNNGPWITDMIASYKKKVRDEVNIGPLSDDYVKFIRLGESLIEQADAGIVGMITNNSYLGGLVHRGMRHCLLEALPRIAITNLGGNSALGDVAPDGGPDENVFAIQQGVAVSVLTRGVGQKKSDPVCLYSRLYGPKESKYIELAAKPQSRVGLKPIAVADEFAFFLPKDFSLREEVERYEPIDRIFPVGGTCVETRHDSLLIAISKKELEARMKAFGDLKIDDAEITNRYGISDTRTWVMSDARAFVANTADHPVEQILYRPFDLRWCYYEPNIIERGSHALPTMRHLRKSAMNLALITSRQVARGAGFDSALITRCIAEKKCADSTRSSSLYPLYVQEEDLFSGEIRVNLGPTAKKWLHEHLGGSVAEGDPHRLIAYVYAILYSPMYRLRYSEFLRISFPRIPLGANGELLRALISLGEKLIELHLMESPRLKVRGITAEGSGEFMVEKVSYSDETVWIDKDQSRGFKGVPEEVWNFHIGGYQVCQKWLKDRQAKGGKNPRPGRVLTDEDIEHYQKIVVALSETIRIMAEIDEVIEAHGGWPNAFQTGEDEESTAETGDLGGASMAAEASPPYGDEEA